MRKPAPVETIEAYCKLFGSGETVDAAASAQRFGMHLVDEKMSITFTPRDRSFSRGVAMRIWRTNNLGGIDLDVEPSMKLPFAKLRDAFGPFKFVPRMHPGDDYEFLARWTPAGSKVGCGIVVTLRAHTDRPTGHEAIARVSITS